MSRNFCCCCDLRTGCIVFAWLQIMAIVIAIPNAASPIVLLNPATENAFNIHVDISSYNWYNSNYNWKTSYYEALQPSMSTLITELVIKAITCVALIVGAVKRNHLFMQPWIFLQCFESVILTLGFIGLFITSCFVPVLFIATFLSGILAALHWYFWVNVRFLYKQDIVPPFVMWRKFTSNNP